MAQPPAILRYLYMGTSDFDRDLDYYTRLLEGKKVWAFAAFGARVAALRLWRGPLLLLADHRPAPSCMPIFEVEDLDATVKALRRRGWQPEGVRFEIPNGPCYSFKDPSGNPLAIFQDVRPNQMERAYRDPDNPRAIRG